MHDCVILLCVCTAIEATAVRLFPLGNSERHLLVFCFCSGGFLTLLMSNVRSNQQFTLGGAPGRQPRPVVARSRSTALQLLQPAAVSQVAR
eukprot:COSAG01_NODE_19_length_39011_cov_38.134968_36_plen_91_part_00